MTRQERSLEKKTAHTSVGFGGQWNHVPEKWIYKNVGHDRTSVIRNCGINWRFGIIVIVYAVKTKL